MQYVNTKKIKTCILYLTISISVNMLNSQVLWYGDPDLSVNDNFRRLDPDGNSNPTGDDCIDDPNNPPFVTTPTDAEFGKYWRITKPISRKRAEFARTTGDVNSFTPLKGNTYFYGWRWRINSTPNLNDGISVFQWKTADGGDINTNKQNYPFTMSYDGTVLSLNAFGPAEPNWNRPGSITQRRTTLWQGTITEDEWMTFVINVKVDDSFDMINNRYEGYVEFWFNGEQQILTNFDSNEYQVVLADSDKRAYHKTFDGVEVYPKWGSYNENACYFEVITDFDDMRVALTYSEALPSDSNDGNSSGLEGFYKIKHSVTGKYWTVAPEASPNQNIISTDEIIPDNETQIFEIKSVGSAGYYNISCSDPNWDSVRFEGQNVYPTSTSTPTTATNNTRIFEFISNGSGAYDIHTPQTTTPRIAYDDFGDVRYTTSFGANTKWILELQQTLSSQEFSTDQIKLYPNPVKDVLNLKTALQGLTSIRIYDLSGKIVKVLSSKSGVNEILISTQQLKSGMYFLEISSGSNKTVKKFVKY